MPKTLNNIVLYIIIGFPLRLCASPQMPDYIIFNNDTIATYDLLLEKYLQTFDTADTQSLFGLSFREGGSFSCWRGYQAIYKIENDSIFLTAIIKCGERSQSFIDKAASAQKMKATFGNRLHNGKVLVSWFSGDVSFPLSDKLLRWDGVFHRIFERETVVTVNQGKVTRIADVDNYVDDPRAIDRRYNHKIANVLFKKLKKANWHKKADCDCSAEYIVTVGEMGKVSQVAMAGYTREEEIEQEWQRDDFDFCILTALNALSELTFDILKDRGQPIKEDVFLEIWFTEKGNIENWTD